MSKEKYDIDRLFRDKLSSAKATPSSSSDKLYESIKSDSASFFPKPSPFYKKGWVLFTGGLFIGIILTYGIMSLPVSKKLQQTETLPSHLVSDTIQTLTNKPATLKREDTPVIDADTINKTQKQTLTLDTVSSKKTLPSLDETKPISLDTTSLHQDALTQPTTAPSKELDTEDTSTSPSIFEQLKTQSEQDSIKKSLFKDKK